MRKILIASPVKDAFPVYHTQALIAVLQARMTDCIFGFMYCASGGIHFARDQMADYAIKHKFDELISWDIDLKPSVEDFQRLISHTEQEIVCGFYAKKDKFTHFNVQRILGVEPDDSGLVRVDRCAIGFSKVKVSAFEKIRANTPERAYNLQNEGEKEPKAYHQFYPTELFGPNTVQGKLDAITSLKQSYGKWTNEQIVMSLLDILDAHPSALHPLKTSNEPNLYLGEDYGFCMLAKQAGIPLYVDTQLLIPHSGLCDYPIPTEDLVKMLQEPWRNYFQPAGVSGCTQAPDPAPFSIIKWGGEAIWPSDYIRPGLSADHCRDVLKGCYDIPCELHSPIILDIGANIGAFARWASARWPGATIRCYEPNPDNFALLGRTIKEYLTNCEVSRSNLAISNASGETELYPCGFNCGEHTTVLRDDLKAGKTPIKVPCLDAAELPLADIIKIDAEGAELLILERLATTNRLFYVRAIMLEYHAAPHRIAISNLLGTHGFTLYSQSIHSEHRGVLKFLRAKPHA